MKRFWVALLAAAMVAGFSLSASAMDVKFSGSYYVTGIYADNWGLGENSTSSSLYGQRLRMGTEFKIAEGLTLTTRFDALEGRWGQFGTYGSETSRHAGEDDDNISFDRAWITFNSLFGQFKVGRGNSGDWGTPFADGSVDSDSIQYKWASGPVVLGGVAEKMAEGWGRDPVTPEADNDDDVYHVYGLYKWSSGIAGLKVKYVRTAVNSSEDLGGFKTEYWTLQPYAQATFGPVFVEAEFNYQWGDFQDYEAGVDGTDRDLEGWNAYVHAKADVGNFYFGGFWAFVSGQVPDDDDFTVGPLGGITWNPTLILWNEYTNKWAGRLGYDNAKIGLSGGQAMTNAHLFQLYAGMKPAPKWDIKASVSYALADEESGLNPATTSSADYIEYDDDEYGWEADLTASYKIYDNLTYTVGFGYLWAGDWFKGPAADPGEVDDTYLVMHRLDLVF